jgi:Bacterial PH domain
MLPMVRIYRSKVDGILVVCLAVLPAVLLLVLGSVLPDEWLGASVALRGVLTLMLALFVWTLMSTSYAIDAASLQVRSGPFHWAIALEDIRSVSATRDVTSAPALSLDRLRIEYGVRRSILVSPRERAAFIADLQRRGVRGIQGA